MSAAAYNRGSRALSRAIEREGAGTVATARAERRAHNDERARLLSEIETLRKSLQKSERSRAILRLTLKQERVDRAEERDRAERNYRFAVRTLARRAGLDTAEKRSNG